MKIEEIAMKDKASAIIQASHEAADLSKDFLRYFDSIVEPYRRTDTERTRAKAAFEMWWIEKRTGHDFLEKDENKLKSYYQKCKEIMKSDLSWEERYDGVFEIAGLVRQIAVIDYCDPDTTYKEDVKAYMRGFTEMMKQKGLL